MHIGELWCGNGLCCLWRFEASEHHDGEGYDVAAGGVLVVQSVHSEESPCSEWVPGMQDAAEDARGAETDVRIAESVAEAGAQFGTAKRGESMKLGKLLKP